jgi:hypothetical protein
MPTYKRFRKQVPLVIICVDSPVFYFSDRMAQRLIDCGVARRIEPGEVFRQSGWLSWMANV